ncbi:MATE family efflux transporter [Exiguobacterium flavidum]|uniref:MATE family efflux transporter n=1 Tax=Exiguobacterium flavidum TaxID=2184695 RepID=UPI000DF84DE3|nr:MATE family efflux transporter [Exiguobacterium flavidum]
MKQTDLTAGPVRNVLLALALPLVGSSLLQFTYSLVDMFFVGALGSDAVASIGAASFYILLGQSIQAIIVVGAGIKVAQAVGKKDEALAIRQVKAAMLANLVFGLSYMVVLLFAGRYLIGFLNMDSDNVEALAYQYLSVSAPMLLFSFYNLLHARLFSSYGNTTAALRINAAGVIINMILSPILIYPLGFGVVGAALATLIAQLIMFFAFYRRGLALFKTSVPVKPLRSDFREIFRLGFPMAAQRVLFTAVGILLGRMIGSYGTDAIAAQRIGLQIESVAYMMIGGLNGAIASFTGQNLGAGKRERIHEGYRSAVRFGILYTSLITLIFLSMPQQLIGLFVDDAGTIEIGANYLRIIGISLAFASLEMVGNGYFSGVGLPKIPAAISIIFTIGRLPVAMLLEPYLGIDAIWWSIALTSIIKGLISAWMVRLTKKEVDDLVHII